MLVSLELTPNEQIWIDEHPQIELGIGNTWAPFIFPSPDGNHEGFDVDMIALINQRLGTDIKLVPGSWNMMVEQAKNGKIDGLAESTSSGNREDFFNFTEIYINTYYALITTPDKVDEIKIKNANDLKVAYLEGNSWLEFLMEDLGIIDKLEANSENEAFKYVIEGKADASLIAIGIYSEMRKIFYDNISIGRVFLEDEYKLDIVYSIRKDWPELVTLINKALADISPQEKNEIFENWIGISLDDYAPWNMLTNDEIQWIDDNPIIKVATEPGYPPMEFFDKDDNYIGIAPEILGLISEKTGLEFEIIKLHSWQECIDQAKIRKVDMWSSATSSPERNVYMNFNDPHTILPAVLIGKKELQENIHLKDIKGLRLVTVEGYVWQEYLKRDYPELKLRVVADVLTGLREVSFGSADLFLNDLATASFYIHQEGINNLKVITQTDYRTRLSFASRNDWPLLNSIINKTLKSIPDDTMKEIHQKWISLEPISIFANQNFWLIIGSLFGVSLIIVVIVFIWNSALKKQISIKTEELQSSKEDYKLLIENQTDILVKIDPDGKFLFVNLSFCEKFGKSEEDILGSNFMKFVFEDDRSLMEKRPKELFSPPYTYYYELRACTIDGVKWFAWQNKAILDDQNDVIEIISLGRDITKQKEAEQAIELKSRELENQLEKSEKNRIANLIILKDLNKITKDLKSEINERLHTEEILKQRMSELEIFNNATVDRELMINEHRKEINKLLVQSGKEAKYEIVE